MFFQDFKDCKCINRIKYPLELFPDVSKVYVIFRYSHFPITFIFEHYIFCNMVLIWCQVLLNKNLEILHDLLQFTNLVGGLLDVQYVNILCAVY